MTNGSNNWDVPYSTICFFRDVLQSHAKVQSSQRRNDIVFEIRRKGNLSDVIAVIVNRYTLGLADLLQARQEFPLMTCIVTGGDWNSWTSQAKQYGLDNKIGVFNTSEFLGALNRKEMHKYVSPEQRRRDAEKCRRPS